VWSAITAPRHILYIESWNWSDNPWGTIGYFFRFLFLDGFDYQYYFLIVIFQFYLVFPLLWKLGRSKLFAGIFLILHLLVTSPIEAYLDIFGLHLPPLHSNMLILHWFWCYMGIYAACNRDFLADVAKRWSLNRVLLVWFGFFALLNIEFVFNMRAGKALSDIDHFNRWSVVLYCLGSLLLFLKLKPRLSKTIISNPNFDFLFTHVAPYTFFVYLVHTHVLRFVDYLAYEDTGFDLLSRIFFVVLGSYGLAWLAQWLLDEFPKLRFVLGLPGHPLALRSLPGVKRFTTYFALNWGRKARSNSTG